MTYPAPIFPFGNLLTLKGRPFYGVVKVVGYDWEHPEYTNLEGSISFKSQEVIDGGIGQWLLGVNLPNTTNNFFSIVNASNAATPLVIDPNTSYVGINNNSPSYNLDVTGNSHTSQVHTVDQQVIINAADGNVSIKNPVAGSGLVMQGFSSSSSFGQLRIVSNTGAWLDNVKTTYFQMQNDVNNNATFMGGSYGTYTPLSRLQFASSYTTITDSNFNLTPVPDSLLELVASTDKKLLKLIGVASQTADYINVIDSLSNIILSLDVSGNLTISGDLIINGNILANGDAIARFVASAPISSSDTGTKGDYFINNTTAYFCINTDTWVKINGVISSF